MGDEDSRGSWCSLSPWLAQGLDLWATALRHAEGGKDERESWPLAGLDGRPLAALGFQSVFWEGREFGR